MKAKQEDSIFLSGGFQRVLSLIQETFKRFIVDSNFEDRKDSVVTLLVIERHADSDRIS